MNIYALQAVNIKVTSAYLYGYTTMYKMILL